MKQIVKLNEPNSLLEHRANAHSNFDNIPSNIKEQLRQNLLSEQGYICCYCMKRIPESNPPNLKVEHFCCQADNEHLQLTYSNLFASCTGNEGQPKKIQTCDTKKGNSRLTINPISYPPNCETLFKFNAEGEISSVNDDAEINRQINEILNLNMQTLKDNRREIYIEVQKNVEAESRRLGSKQLKLRYFEKERSKWLNRLDNKFKPFCLVAVYYLNKKIRQSQA
jgi:uncharacterized protein (TIGR02646 family)